MSNRNRRRKPNRRNKKVHPGGDGFITRLFASTKGADPSDEHDWYLDSPDVKLTRVFAIVLILHIVAVGGILAFKMIEKASGPQEIASRSIAAAQSSESTRTKPIAPVPNLESSTEEASAKQQPEEEAIIVPHPASKDHLEYRVRASDSLASIAKEQGVSVADIRRLNHLNNGDKIHTGKWLTLPRTTDHANLEGLPSATATRKPALVAASIKPAVEAPAARKPTTAETSYVVSAGDTFYGISKKFGVSYQEIMSANGIDSPQALRTGMTLSIPGN